MKLTPNLLDDLKPTDPLMIGPWIACLSYSIRDTNIFTAFRDDIGISVRDEPDDAMVVAFVKWFNATVWGGK